MQLDSDPIYLYGEMFEKRERGREGMVTVRKTLSCIVIPKGVACCAAGVAPSVCPAVGRRRGR